MSRLAWAERDHGWRAGPYQIELAAPQLWVCTRHRRFGLVSVEMTSGSLNALKGRVERVEFRRRCVRRSVLHLAAFLVSMVMIVVTVMAAGRLTPLLVIVFTSLGLFSAVRAIDWVISRSWESLRLDYQ